MLKLVRKIFSNIIFKLIFLIILSMAVFGFMGGRFIFVRASNNQVNIFSNTFTTEQSEGDARWENIGNSTSQDLSPQADFASFNQENSAYIVFPPYAEASGGEAPSNETSGGEVESVEVVPAEEYSEPNVENEAGENPASDQSTDNSAETPVVDQSADNESGQTENPDSGIDADGTVDAAAEEAAPAEQAPASERSDDAPSDDAGDVSMAGKLKESLRQVLGIFQPSAVLNPKSANAADPDGTADEFLNQAGPVKQSIIFSDFSVPAGYETNIVSGINLRLSLAAKSQLAEDSLSFEYSIGGDWKELGEINISDEVSNGQSGDYLQFPLPADVSWADINKLKIKASYENPAPLSKENGDEVKIYLDALWVEVNYYDPNEKLNEEIPAEEELSDNPNTQIDLISGKKDFTTKEIPEFNFRFSKKKGMLEKLWSEIVNFFSDEYSGIQISAKLKDWQDDKISSKIDVQYNENGEFEVRLPEYMRQFKPGKDSLEITIDDDGEVSTMTQDFTWGVLAFNTDLSVYEPGKQAFLQMASLNDSGHTLCDSNLQLEITAPSSETTIFSVSADEILESKTCGADNVTDNPDYYVFYTPAEEGDYQVKLTNLDNGYSVTDTFKAEHDSRFVVERKSATRINPFKSGYAMHIKATIQEDFSGFLRETVPAAFRLGEISKGGRIEPGADEFSQIISWPVELFAGDSIEFEYTYFAPKISPQFYLMGPLLAYADDQVIYTEEREWQIASDALTVAYVKNRVSSGLIDANPNETTITSLSGFSNGNYILFSGVGSINANSATTRMQNSLDAGGANFATTQEQNEGPDNNAAQQDDRWAYFSMLNRTMSSAETVRLQALDLSGAGVEDESYILGIATSSLGVWNKDYFWAENATVDNTIGTTIAGENNRASITFTADGTSRYLIIAEAMTHSNAADNIAEMAIWDGSAAMVNHIRDTENVADEPVLFAATTTVPTAGSKTYSVRVRGEVLNTSVHYYSSAILIIRLDYYENYSCDGRYNAGTISVTPAFNSVASTSLQLSNGGDVVALYFGGFTSGTQNNEVALRARQDSTVLFKNDEQDVGDSTGRNAVWETTDVHNVLWLDNIAGVNTSTHFYDMAMQASVSGPTSRWSLVCAWSKAEKPILIASATGTQATAMGIPSADNYLGGKFILVGTVGTSSVTGITITENGTVDAQNNLSNIKLYYDLDISAPYDCASESFSTSDTRFGATSSSFSAANGTASFSGNVVASTTAAMCVYTALDVGVNASTNQTLNIDISNPYTDITGPGIVGPLTTVSITGTTTLYHAITLSAIGTQTAVIDLNSDNTYIGGTFVLTNNFDTHNITGITIAENGTVDAQNDLSNIKLFYDLDTSSPYNCASESYSGTDARFGATSTSFSAANGTAVFTGTTTASTTAAMCVYVVMDFNPSGTDGDTVEIQITNPATDITLNSGVAEPATAVLLPGTTTLNGPNESVLANAQRKADLFTDIPNDGWTNENEINLSALASLIPGATTSKFDFYFQLVDETGTFSTATTAPGSTCVTGAAYGGCAPKIWKTSASTTVWYDTAWGYRKKITINASQVATTTSGFVVLATTTDPDLAYTTFGGHVASSTGGDILITDSDGLTKLDYEREFYASSTGQLVIWIETAISSTTNKDLYIYYGNAVTTVNQENRTGTWNSGYTLVNHMKDDPGPGVAGDIKDSTSNANNAQATANMAPSALVNGWLGRSISFDGDQDGLTVPSSGSMNGATGAGQRRTWSYWLNFTTVTENTLLTDKNAFGGESLWSEAHSAGGNKIKGGVAGTGQLSSATTFNTGQWYHIVFDYDGANSRLYVNGALDAGPNAQVAPADSATVWSIMGSAALYEVNGQLDELRVTNVTHAADWVLTEYNNQSSVSTFLSFADEEAILGTTYEGIVNVATIPDRGSSTDMALGYKWQVLACGAAGGCSFWDDFNSTLPNFRVDTVMPGAPGNLSLATTTATTITLNFGGQTDEANFAYYKIFYKIGISGAEITDLSHADADMNFKNYNGTATTTITGLQSDTQYVINIWAYDLAGNLAPAATELIVTTSVAPNYHARSVEFLAGAYSGNGATGQLSNTAQTFSVFDLQLAETETEIRNAYIVFESQFEAYHQNSGNYTGYQLAFDTCAAPCTADAFSGSGRVLASSTSVLAYDATSTNQARILMDVTAEAQLAAYAGEGGDMEAQVGYKLQTNIATNSIAFAKATLVVTYAYNDDATTDITNTVVYPLESKTAGDSGSRRASSSDDCVRNSNCPTFDYNLSIPELGSSLSQWFQLEGINIGHGSFDASTTVNLQTFDVNSAAFVQEAGNGGEQGNFPGMIFNNVYGYAENATQTLEVHLTSPGAATYYALGGEVKETYTASKSAAVKTRTVSFPLGILTTGQSSSVFNLSTAVYFPENGTGSGVVSVKKAWLRVIGNDYLPGAYNITVSSKVGSNAQSGNYVYNINAGTEMVKPAFKVIHVIPLADYAELNQANASDPKTVTAYTTNSSVNMGGVSAELVITYLYTDESSGYLSSLSLYGGQPDMTANSQAATATIANSVFPEMRGALTLRAAALLGSFLFTDSDADMPSAWFTMDMNIAPGTPVCNPTGNFSGHSDDMNSFMEYYKDVTSAFSVTDRESYTACYANNNPADATAGAKMNAIFLYTYQWDAPPSQLTENDWRWYNNADAATPGAARAAENTGISGVNLGDALRLRLNIGVSRTDLATSTQSFKLQFAGGTDCSAISSSSWTDLGGVAASTAWRGYNNPTPADGDALSAAQLISSTRAESYEEANSSAANPAGIPDGNFAEWDWVVYNNSATSSTDFCFRMVKSTGVELDDYLSDSYPTVLTAPANTAPNAPSGLQQARSNGALIANSSWVNQNTIKLTATATDPNISEALTLYFELASSSASFRTATTVPSGACAPNTTYAACAAKVWVATSTAGDYRTTPFTGTTTLVGLPDYEGYKWQVMTCDDDSTCSNWTQFNATTPNFDVDITLPSAPGNLTFATSTPTAITLAYGASTVETNFLQYRIFYKVKVGTSTPTESDTEQTDSNLSFKDYNTATSTLVLSLAAGTTYVFNIWAYDRAGNKATATTAVYGTTTSSFNPPSGFITVSTRQKIDGSKTVSLTLLVDDPDNNDTLRAKVMYRPGEDCNFSGTSSDPTIDTADAKTYATYGDPKVDNAYPYQIGSSTGWIMTSPGQNFVFSEWRSYVDEPTANGKYCLGVVVNDTTFDQVATHTRVITLDNVDPTQPGPLTLAQKNYDSVWLSFGSSSVDSNFSEYKIFYKQGLSGVTTSDTLWSKTDDPQLGAANYETGTSTLITGLSHNTDYVFNIFAYDTYGNIATSSTELHVKTNAAPVNISADGQYLSDGITAILNGSWISTSSVLLKASAHDQDAGDLVTFYYQLITATGTFASALTPPAITCAYNTDYASCASKIWAIATTSSALPAGWYDSNWLYRKKITINASQVPANQTSFPVFASTTDADLAANARADGYDIVFTDSTGTSTLNYEREYYNSATGQFAAWVKTNISSTTNTDLYLYYGNTGAITDSATTTGVWDANYHGVWHLAENVVDEATLAGAHRDSTFYNNHGGQNGNNEISAWIHQGQDFDGLNDYVSIPNSSSLSLTNSVTMEAWVNGAIGTVPASQKLTYTTVGTTTFCVPAGVTSITVKSWGGGGGGGAGALGNPVTMRSNFGGAGAGAGFVQSTLYVVPGECLTVLVAGGAGGGSYIAGVGSAGGGGGGGGRSGILRSTTPLAIAAGGGGGGGASAARDYSEGANGGVGGGTSGTAGANSTSAIGGGPGTQVGGGAAGTGTNAGTAGVSLYAGLGAAGRNAEGADGGGGTAGAIGGGAGGLGNISAGYAGAGGGGGGFYGGGGGGESGAANSAGAGGGGGSSYVTGLSTSTYSGANKNAGNNSDSDYDGNAGIGGDAGTPSTAGSAGNPGLVVISYTPSIVLMGKGSAYQVNLNDSSILTGAIGSSTATTTLNSGWHMVAMTYDRNGGSSQLKLFMDGIVQATAATSAAISANSNPISLGEFFDGAVDELRVSSSSRSADWMRTTYNNQRSVANFMTISTESTVTSYYESMLVITIPDNPDYATGYKWQVIACDDDNDCTAWDKFNLATPNFMIDTVAPTAPGQLTLNSKTSSNITLDFGTATDEDNFTEYKVFYSTSSPVTESDTLISSSTESSLGYKNYNSATNFTINNLNPATTYFFNIWAYDAVGHKASSTVTLVTTNSAISTPGAMFYTRNNRAIYYRVWNGTAWGGEQNSGNITGVGENIRHIRAIRSDSGAKIGLLFKTWDGTNQKWWGAVYRYGANDFVNVSALGTTWVSAVNNNLITGCIAPLSGGEFMIVRNDNASNGAVAFSWDGVNGWTTEGTVPGTADSGKMGVMNACELVRRPGTDNYLLLSFDDDADTGSMYYHGGATYASTSWTTWRELSTDAANTDNFTGSAFFDPSNNTRGAINFSNSATNGYTSAQYFDCTSNSISYGATQLSPATAPGNWDNAFVHGEFAIDPNSAGIAYFAGRDTGGQLNVYKVTTAGSAVTWATSTSGDNIYNNNLYSDINYAQKPFALSFYKPGKGVVIGNTASNIAPFYSVITTAVNTLTATSAVEGAVANNYSRVRAYNDPNEYEFIAIFQNDDVDYSAVFFDPSNTRFYNSGNQAWNELVTTSAAADKDDECTTFAYTKINSEPDFPVALGQFKNNGTTTIANQAWTNETSVKFRASAVDPDTYGGVKLYLNLVANTDTLATGTTESAFNACASTTAWTACASKIWQIASSSMGDYSVVPFTATATITALASSTIGYKWQVIACDNLAVCSAWSAFNAAQPNFYVDDYAPSAPGNLTAFSINSSSITLQFGSATNEQSFSEYKIFYKAGSSGVTEANTPWTQANDAHLASKTYGGASYTTVTGLASSTQYVFNIWAYDLAGNRASATAEVSTTTSALSSINQSSFRLEDDDGTNVNSNTFPVAASTTLPNLYIGERFAVRIQIENTGGDAKSNIVYKLQFENNTDAPGTWTDVGAATAMSYALGLAGSNGDTISSPAKAEANARTWSDGRWYEGTNQTGSLSIAKTAYTELVFMVKNNNAAAGKTYRFRLYNQTENSALEAYAKYPVVTTVASDTIKYSKGILASLPSATSTLDYPLDPKGYADVLSDDAIRDAATSSSNFPVYLFATKHGNNTDAASSTWNGQSTVGAASGNVYLQVYRFGSVNAWVTVATETAAVANVDFTLTGGVNSYLSDYYDENNFIYWRVYQASGSETLKTDFFSANFALPIPETRQIHYRWRKDNGSEPLATWLEAEDIASPVAGSEIGKGSTTRLRVETVNLGGGDAANYNYRLEYASSSLGCATDPGGWVAVPATAAGGEHFEIGDSPYVGDGTTTTAQLSNSEGYTFVAGDVVDDATSVSANITLPERRYTEIEYTLFVTDDADDAQTYCFRVTNNGAALDAYSIFPSVTLSGSTNHAPNFIVQPTDNDASGASASTSPTDEGTNVTFFATASDDDDNQYYLAICQSAGILAGNDGAPTCTGGAWCVSGATASGTQAACAYAATSSSPENNDWYAYVCDKVFGFGQAKCSAFSQGNDFSYGSPFVVNHAPTYTSVSTVDNNRNPGQTFKVTAVSADTDSSGGADTLRMFVCTTNDIISYGAGCASTTVCSVMSTSSPNPSCFFTPPAPSPAGTTTYYAFVYDSHGLATNPVSRSNTYTINNSAPALGGLVLNNGANITLNIKDAPDLAVQAVNNSVMDLNGCGDIDSTIGTVYMSNATNGYNCTANNNDCYLATTTACVMSDCASSTDMIATITCTVNMKYYAVPTATSTNNPWESYSWMSYMLVYDGAHYSAATSAVNVVDVNVNVALDVAETEINFGPSMYAGENTGTKNSTTTVYNAGNSPINSNIRGNDLISPPALPIEVGNIKWDLVNFDYELGIKPLSSSFQLVDIVDPRPTSTLGVADGIYWGIAIPFTAESKTFWGQNTFQAVVDNGDWIVNY